MSAAVSSSSAQTTISGMTVVGVPHSCSPNGHISDPNPSLPTQVKLNEDHQDPPEDLQKVPPHITIIDEYPTKEARAFGTRIER